MKKISLVLLALAMLVSMVACGGAGVSASIENPAGASASQPGSNMNPEMTLYIPKYILGLEALLLSHTDLQELDAAIALKAQEYIGAYQSESGAIQITYNETAGSVTLIATEEFVEKRLEEWGEQIPHDMSNVYNERDCSIVEINCEYGLEPGVFVCDVSLGEDGYAEKREYITYWVMRGPLWQRLYNERSEEVSITVNFLSAETGELYGSITYPEDYMKYF